MAKEMKKIVVQIIGKIVADKLGTALFCVGLLTTLLPQDAAGYVKLENDRILLMNNDSKARAAVESQSYYDTNRTAKTYWVHTGPAAPNRPVTLRNLLAGTNHVMHATDGTRLWELENCRAGSATVVSSARNYIPWGTTARSIVDDATSNLQTDDSEHIKGVASVILRDAENACIYSPVYEEGVGTIYFDAVNAYTTVADIQLVLEIATNALNGVDFRTADNSDANIDWRNVSFASFTVTGAQSLMAGGDLTLLDAAATNLVLASTAGGSALFYRVRAQLNYYGPIRFRIRRTNATSGSPDSTGLALVDNVIASYPPMTAILERYGEDYDLSLRGSEVLGCVGDFDLPFLSQGQTAVRPRAWVRFLRNSGSMAAVKVRNASLVYRWRYLNQVVTPWQTLPFMPEEVSSDDSTVSNLLGSVGVSLANGVGDLEYYFTADVDAPYYMAQDYATTSVGYGEGWSEAITSVTNRANYVDQTPAGGHDYFVRIRESSSPYEFVKLCMSVTTNGTDGFQKEAPVRMELVGTNTWRYCYYVPKNRVGETLRFHFEGRKLVRDPADEFRYASSEHVWKCDLETVPYLPYTSVAGEGYTRDLKVKLDDAATHLIIEFNDNILTYSVKRGSYQNFNFWTTALDGYHRYSECSGEISTNAATGVADAKRKFTANMADWEVQDYTNPFWTENFNTSDTTTYPLNTSFNTMSTPLNGWEAGYGQWIRSVRGSAAVSAAQHEVSFQMAGGGMGYVALDKESGMPAGVGSVSFSARLAQEPRFEDFAVYGDGVTLTNYAVSAKLTMSRLYEATWNPADISPAQPSVSLVGRYRPGKGCYEYRITRIASDQLECALYKWLPVSGRGMMATQLVRNVITSLSENKYTQADSGQPQIVNFHNMLVPGSANEKVNSAWTSAYLLVHNTTENNKPAVRIECMLSDSRISSSLEKEERANQKKVLTHVDKNEPFLKGTYGVGSTDCYAGFGDIRIHDLVSSSDGSVTIEYGGVSAAYDISAGDWSFNADRWQQPTKTEFGDGSLNAVVPTNQTVRLQFRNGNGSWFDSGYEQIVSGFGVNDYSFAPCVSLDYKVRLITGGNFDDDMRTDVVVDDIEITGWRAADYPGLASTDSYGQADQWVYTAATVESSKVCTLQPARGLTWYATGLRSPYLEDGLSMFSFNYANAHSNCVLWLQICTNDIINSVNSMSAALTKTRPEDMCWNTVATFAFTNATPTELAAGTCTHFMSLRAPYRGFMRLVVAPEVMRCAEEQVGLFDRDVAYGQITITDISCYNEPLLDTTRVWRGWNIHTEGWNASDKQYAYLPDSPEGLSCSLNFSAIAADNDPSRPDTCGIGLSRPDLAHEYAANNSFVQCPPLTNGIGMVTFRARTFTTNQTVASYITLFGSAEPDTCQVDVPEAWDKLATFRITNTTYQTYKWSTTDDALRYAAIRLEVVGSRHGRMPASSVVQDWEQPPETPIQRVWVDEITVSEPTPVRVVFRNVRPFRSGLAETVDPQPIPNVMDSREQPGPGESWGIQATVEPQQMSDEFVTTSMVVYAAFYRGVSPWGYTAWRDKVSAVKLERVGSGLTFRSTANNPASIVGPDMTADGSVPDSVWQYYVWAEYLDKSGVRHAHGLDANEWCPPSWYDGVANLNEQYGEGLADRFSGYTILGLNPNVWINAMVFSPHVRQIVGDDTNNNVSVMLRKGDSTKIVYTTDSWYQIGEVTTNGVTIAEARGRGSRTDTPAHKWTLELENVQGTIDVRVGAETGSDVTAAALTQNNRYYDAIMAWLAAQGDDDEGLYMAEQWDLGNRKVGDLDLVSMYWLDIDPTSPGWVLKGGMGSLSGATPVAPIVVDDSELGPQTNVRVVVTMMITNRLNATAYAPSCLQGVEPGSVSSGYDGKQNWIGPTFKVCGALQKADVRDVYLPLRRFVFGPGSFDENFQAVIDVCDPFGPNSPGYDQDWSGDATTPIFYKWKISDESPTESGTPERLESDSTYH